MQGNKINRSEAALFLIAMSIIGIGIFYLGPSITYFVTKEIAFSDNVDVVVTSNGSYEWNIQNPGSLKSLRLTGKVTTYGRARVYLENEDGRYLVFDSELLRQAEEQNVSNMLTGLVAGGNGNNGNNGNDNGNNGNSNGNENKKPKWKGESEFIVNGTTIINLSEHFEDEDNDTLVFEVSDLQDVNATIADDIAIIIPALNEDYNTTISFIASDGTDSKSHLASLFVLNSNIDFEYIGNNTNEAINETIEIPINDSLTNQSTTNLTNQTITDETNQTAIDATNQTQTNMTMNQTQSNLTSNQTASRTITLNLSYNSGTFFDTNDNGEESINGIVDVSILGTKFGWDADETKLCSRWDIYNLQAPSLDTFCNGNSDCCSFIGLAADKSNWSENYYASYGKDGAGNENIVYAQVIYYDVNLSIENPYSEIYSSEIKNLSVKFFEDQEEFEGVCADTCILSGLNKSSYTLSFEIEGDAVLEIGSIQYSVDIDVENSAPELISNFSNITLVSNSNLSINLSQYFSDPDNDELHFGHYEMENISIIFENESAIIIPDKDFEGVRYSYFVANDSEKATASNLFMINVTRNETINATIQISEANLSGFDSLIIQNASGFNLAIIDSSGNMKIIGELLENTGPVSGVSDFAIQDPEGNLNLVITTKGNMMLKGYLNVNMSNLSPPQNSFIIENETGNVVAYVNNTGSLFLTGSFEQNASLEGYI